MVWYLCLGVLAAFGALCALWTCFGGLVRGSRGGALVCVCRPDGREQAFVRRYRFLREMGLLKCPLLLVCGTEEMPSGALYPGVEICSLEALPARLELERNQLG